MENKPMISETEKEKLFKTVHGRKSEAPVCVAFSGGGQQPDSQAGV